MHEWLDQARLRLAETVGGEASDYELGSVDSDRLLELARIAAHESGERTNAPLLSYLVGLAHGRHPEHDLSGLVDRALGRS
jgi:hypothetical protein